MKATELRIGNWIEKDGKQYQITAIGIFCCGVKHNPIPLTEEWLIKFGFSKSDRIKKTNFQLSEGIIDIYESPEVFNKSNDIAVFLGNYQNEFFDLVIENWNYGEMICATSEIQYVHQLQNLYFALTGEELTL